MANVWVGSHPKSGNVLLQKNVNGKRIRLSTGRKSDARSLAWFKKHSEEEFWKLYYDKFDEDNNNSIKFKEYGKLVVEATKSNRNIFSQRTEELKFEKLCIYFGDFAMDKIKPSDIQLWQAELTVGPKTAREFRSTLNIIFEFAVDDEIIHKNPIKRIKPPRKIWHEVEFFNEEERKSLLENSDGQMHNIIKFAFYSGLRAGEITGLKWENIDFDEKKINVCSRMRKGDEDLPKGGKIRLIDLLPQAEASLLSQREKTGLSKYVFLNKKGVHYYSESCITQSIQIICKKFGIKGGGLQKIRRSHNTMLKQNGLPVDWILHQMGHNEEQMNRNHYTGRITVDVSKLGSIA